MASPQKENGYTPIAHEIMEALAKIKIPGQARQILDVIFRKTYGWGKCADKISLKQFVELTGLPKVRVCRGIQNLLSMNLITKNGNAISHFTKNGNDYDVIYGIQKDYDKWQTLPKKTTLPKKITHVTKKVLETLPKMVTLPIKTTNTKLTITKDVPFGKIVSYLNEKSGKRFQPTTDETKRVIVARWNQGYTLEDFKKVIDIKCGKWLTDPKYIDYLRPQTLFGTKFESYLNETPAKQKETDNDTKYNFE